MSGPDRFRSLETLVAVADGGSFSEAARRLGVTPGAVSRQIARLEEHLDTRLIHRTTRSQSLTEAGRTYLERLRPVLHEVLAAESSLRDTDSAPLRGRLRLTAPRVLGRVVLMPTVLDFLQRWPEVQVDVLLTDSWVDLTGEGVDLALRVARTLPDSRLVGKRVSDYTSTLVASPDYLATHGTPIRAAELSNHQGLMLRTSSAEVSWPTTEGALHPRPRLVSDDLGVLYNAARRGLGITALPRLWVARALADGVLVEVLPGALTLRREVWLLRPDRTYTLRVVSAFARATAEAFADPVRTPWDEDA